MASGLVENSNPGFPEELLIEILLKLPVKSIVRCTSVSKSWYKLITGPSFISFHLKKSVEKSHNLVRRCKSTQPRGTEYYSLHSDDESFDIYSKFECRFPCSGDFFRLIGICNGLICLSDDQRSISKNIILWNPMIRKAIQLPKSGEFSSTQTLGFGFDPESNDYKVVRISYHRNFDHQFGFGQKEVELYNLSSNSWRKIGDFESQLVVGIRKPLCLERQETPVFINGSVHWMAYRNLESEGRLIYSVVSFNMQNDEFKEISLPKDLATVGLGGTKQLTIWERKKMLCVTVHDIYSDSTPSVWIMKEYNVEESWIKAFEIDVIWKVNTKWLRPVGFGKNGAILCENGQNSLIYYEHEDEDEDGVIHKKKMKNLLIRNSNRFNHRGSFYVGNFTESLVFLDKGARYSYRE
ncbi:hypothetical protein M9H77_21362 [Catharanthus roseus]|uniref:Uncharacterized protein n=1 Tax=Catharanthus roseus TaxID=4058 RepID=A0ACC0APF6_CATRO|nr:hypothetical protein M9H77_21362 [Catharanthus roseus]